MKWFLGLLALAAAVPATAQQESARFAGEQDAYAPAIVVAGDEYKLEMPASVRGRLEAVSSFPVDGDGTKQTTKLAFQPEVRAGLRFDSRPKDMRWLRLQLEYEHDVTTGALSGVPGYEGERLPNGEKSHHELRRLFARGTFADTVVVSGGYNMSHWGLGLLANDGAHGWTPGSARFTDPRSGDRVIRGAIGTTPLTDLKLVVGGAIDQVEDDDVLLDGDSATQYILRGVVGDGQPTTGGVYLVYREQDSKSGRGFDAYVADVMASTMQKLSIGTLTLAAEGAVIFGQTGLGPNPDFEHHDLLQIAATGKIGLDLGGFGAVLDVLYASGDQNVDDGDQNAFKVDPNYEFGLILFRQVLAAQTGRAVVTASNPLIIGRPVPDLDRVPTGGSPTNTIAFFPRAWVRPIDGWETYGGPLIALTEVRYADPFQSRLAGGQPRNPEGGSPGSLLGVELDIGTRYRTLAWGTEWTAGLEGAVLLPGNAFDDAAGHSMDEVWAGRVLLEVRL